MTNCFQTLPSSSKFGLKLNLRLCTMALVEKALKLPRRMALPLVCAQVG